MRSSTRLSATVDAAAGARQVAAAMRADLFDIDCDFYLAGPRDFVDALGAALLRGRRAGGADRVERHERA